MPIRSDLRHFYQGESWKAARARTIQRAGNVCEVCGKPNGLAVETITGIKLVVIRDSRGACAAVRVPYMYWRLPGQFVGKGGGGWKVHPWRNAFGCEVKDMIPGPAGTFRHNAARLITVVLTVGHRNHIPGDDRDENLACWCQWHHFIFDRQQHHESRAARRDLARPILAAVAV